MDLFGVAHRQGWSKKLPLPKIYHTYPTMMKFGTVMPYVKKIKKYTIHVTCFLSSAGTSTFQREISNFCYILIISYIISNYFDFFKSLMIVLRNEFIYRVNQISLSYNIRHVCQQGSTQDKRPVIDITMFCKNRSTMITYHTT